MRGGRAPARRRAPRWCPTGCRAHPNLPAAKRSQREEPGRPPPVKESLADSSAMCHMDFVGCSWFLGKSGELRFMGRRVRKVRKVSDVSPNPLRGHGRSAPPQEKTWQNIPLSWSTPIGRMSHDPGRFATTPRAPSTFWEHVLSLWPEQTASSSATIVTDIPRVTSQSR